MDDLPEAAIAAFTGATALGQRMRAERPRDGVTIGMISVLSHLDREETMTAGRLAALQGAAPQTLTRTLDRLEEKGFVTRSPSETDRRQILVTLTEAGQRRFMEDMSTRAAWLARAMESLSPTERAVLGLAGTLMASLATWDDIGPAR